MDSPPFNVLALCAGGGGLELGLHKAVRNARVVCLVEIEAYACEVLASRMEEGRLDDAPIFTDLRAFDGRPWRGVVDCISGGYPCQPFSAAGKRRGESDPRHLWPEFARLVREIEPGWCFFENVAGHVSLGLRRVKSELEAMGYRVAAGLFTASEVGAGHRRERVFILAHRESCHRGLHEGRRPEGRGEVVDRGAREGVADATGPERRGADSREREIGRVASGGAGSGVADPKRMRRGDEEAGRRDGAGEPSGRTGEELEDTARNGGGGCNGESRRGRGVREAGHELAAPENAIGRRASGAHDGWRRDSEVRGPRRILADSASDHGHDGERLGECAASCGRRESGVEGCGAGTADAGCERLQGNGTGGAAQGPTGRSGGAEIHEERVDNPAGARRDATRERSEADSGGGERLPWPGRDELPRFPPGPADLDAWRRILTARPDLAPALTLAEEEAFARLRGVAHGVAGRVECRADRLRLLGNGVVPDEACEAFIYLHRSMIA